MKRSLTARFAVFGLSCLLLPFSIGIAHAAGFNSRPLESTTSWLGNSYSGGEKWVQQDIKAIAVTPDGTVFTNVEWDEGGGQAGEYKDGELIRYARHTHGWGQLGGEAITFNSKYVFIGMMMHNEGGGLIDPSTWPEKGVKWFGVSRRLRADISKAVPFPSGKGGKGDTLKQSFLVVAEVPEKTKGHLSGMCADDKRLYVSDPNSNEVKIYDTETMEPVDSWKAERPGSLVMDSKGKIWMLQRKEGKTPAQIVCFDTSGKLLPAKVTLDEGTQPTGFCFAPNGSMMISDNGTNQQVLVYAGFEAKPRMIGFQGAGLGILSGSPGHFENGKFNGPVGVGCDAKSNFYVAQDGQTGGGGTILESYKFTGRLNWRLFGLTFVDMVDIDPVSDFDAFTKEEHFHMDYSKSLGNEWTYAGYTVNRFKYPEDPRLHIWSAGAWVRRMKEKRFLFVNDMNAENLQVYRFSADHGEVAIPSSFFANKHLGKEKGWPPNQPEKGEWVWRDSNGNGAFDKDEFHGKSPEDAPAAQGWWVDSKAGVWLATETKGIRYYAAKDLDDKGNIVWETKPKVFPHPEGFKEVKRIRFSHSSDTLYIGGTTEEHKNQHWKPMGPVLAAYEGVLKGEAKLKWKKVLPYAEGSKGHSSCEPMGFDVASDLIFVPYTGASKENKVKTGRVEVFKTSDGSPVGHVEPGDNVGEIGLQDIRECLRAVKHKSGDYLVFLEDDYKSKVVLYRVKGLGESSADSEKKAEKKPETKKKKSGKKDKEDGDKKEDGDDKKDDDEKKDDEKKDDAEKD
jgi:hypothetical protein